MRKLLLATVALAGLSFQASAADLPVRGPAPAPAPVFVGMNWTGFYVGATVGGQWADASVVHIPTGIKIGADRSSFAGGLVLGYNMQFNRFVLGVELDASLLSGNGSTSDNIAFPFTQRVSADWDGRARVRLGYAFDRALLYVAGGATMRDVTVRLTDDSIFPGLGGSISKTHTGWNLGFGVEYAFTNNWIVRAEYIYDDLGSKTYGFAVPTAGNFADRQVEEKSSTVRVGISYLFGSRQGPVVARY